MTQWHPLVQQNFHFNEQNKPIAYSNRFNLRQGINYIRIKCQVQQTLNGNIRQLYEQCLKRYLDYHSLTENQKSIAEKPAYETLEYQEKRWGSVLFFDTEMQFRGRWDPLFSDWKYISRHTASEGFTYGSLNCGQWTSVILVYPNPFTSLNIEIDIEWSELDEKPDKTITLPSSFRKKGEDKEVLQWFVGELHDHTSRSTGLHNCNNLLHIYQNLGYHFLAVTDHDVPPVSQKDNDSQLGILRGQEIETFSGHAMLLGNDHYVSWCYNDTLRPLYNIIWETHEAGGLFCVLHPFCISLHDKSPSWSFAETDWHYVDLIEIWPGCWQERFPEIMKAFDFWDTLLNHGIRIVGVCGKGTKGQINNVLVEQLPKMLVLAESPSESNILSAIKQGHCYATLEPAVSFWLESESGGALIGDELRLRINDGFLIRIQVSCLNKGGFIRIKTNTGILCEMPLSSTRDSDLKFLQRAQSNMQWFRVEIYQYGRPIDELLAFTNPIYVRGIMSF